MVTVEAIMKIPPSSPIIIFALFLLIFFSKCTVLEVVHAASEIIRREDCKTFAVRARPDPGSCSLCTSMPGNCTLSETCRRVVERLVWVQQEFSLRYWRMLGPVPHFYPIAHVIGFLMCVDVALSVCFRAYCLCSCSCMPNCRNIPPDSKLVRGVGGARA